MLLKLPNLSVKLFFSFLLTHTLIMIITSYISTVIIEKQKNVKNYQSTISNASDRIIHLYESQPEFLGNNITTSQHYELQKFKRYPMTIRDSKDHVIFQSVINAPLNHQLVNFSVTGLSGFQYKVTAFQPKKIESSLMLWLQYIQPLSIIFITVIIVAFSLLLSSIIMTPLRQLRVLSNQLAQEGILQTQKEKKLIVRSDELGQLARKFENMANNIHQNIESQNELLYMISHELRAPLSRLQACAALIADEEACLEQPFIKRIHTESNHVNRLLQAILNLSRIQQLEISELVDLDLDKLIKRNIKNIHRDFPTYTINYTGHTQFIKGQESLLFSALDNILRNACLHNSTKTDIEIRLLSIHNHNKILIRDNGVGVSDIDLKKLCRPFYRKSYQPEWNGFGLGLSIAQRITALHKGDLHLKNHSEGGLEVTLTIPTTLIEP